MNHKQVNLIHTHTQTQTSLAVGFEQLYTKNGLKRNLGQFFTPQYLVDFCILLIKNKNGYLLEPSCGNGAFYKCMSDKSTFIEIDKSVITSNKVLNIDFFDFPTSNKFDVIIGNPPYVDNECFVVKHKTDIKVKANLYLYFIEKSFHHLSENGELIFIVPREFIKLTSAKYVNEMLWKNGTITHYYDFADKKLFDEACADVCVFRYEKNNFSRRTKTFFGEKNFLIQNGIISFSSSKDSKDLVPLGIFFDVKVGAVSGNDKIFANDKGEEFVCSSTAKTGNLKKMIYERYDRELDKYKTVLINRKIKKFDEKNWWSWGRAVKFYSDKPRIYVNCKTRNTNPFFTSNCKMWDGSVLALFPKFNMDANAICHVLNSLNWQEMGFVAGGRYIFSQKSLKESLIDEKNFR